MLRERERESSDGERFFVACPASICFELVLCVASARVQIFRASGHSAGILVHSLDACVPWMWPPIQVELFLMCQPVPGQNDRKGKTDPGDLSQRVQRATCVLDTMGWLFGHILTYLNSLPILSWLGQPVGDHSFPKQQPSKACWNRTVPDLISTGD